MCHSVSYHSYTAKFSTCPINLICLARAGMYSVAFMHYWLPDLQYITCPGHGGQGLNASPVWPPIYRSSLRLRPPIHLTSLHLQPPIYRSSLTSHTHFTVSAFNACAQKGEGGQLPVELCIR